MSIVFHLKELKSKSAVTLISSHWRVQLLDTIRDIHEGPVGRLLRLALAG